jgi:23S rRNA pseudouridine2605 synthase
VPIKKRIGLARVLSKSGYCSRSQAAKLIRAGHVTVNGRVTKNPEGPVRSPQDRIAIDGADLEKTPPAYLMMNKPRGIVTTASDEQGRKTVYDLLPPGASWVGPIGRLDKGSEGLLLLTNDSDWAARISASATHLEKKYHVQIDRVPDEDLLKRIIRRTATSVRTDAGDHLGGEDLRAKAASILRHGDKHGWLEIVLDEGKNRQIRRLLEALQIKVLRLVRVSIGPVDLGDLKKSLTRNLTAAEKNALDRAIQTSS